MTLTIIIISYNTKQLLFECLASIPESKKYQIIVVDNASKDGSADMVAKDFPQVSLIRSKTNTGFAHANNLGLKLAKGRHVIFLNSDTQIKEDALETLINFLDSHQQVGAVTPRVLLPDGALDLACHRGMPTPWNALTYFSKLESLLPQIKLFSGYHQTYKDFNQAHQIDATAMTAMMVKKQVIEKVGNLDDSFFPLRRRLGLLQTHNRRWLPHLLRARSRRSPPQKRLR
jgi:GT2 family glycosyltransferase